MRRTAFIFALLTSSTIALFTAGCGGPSAIVPETTLQTAKNWQILVASDYDSRTDFDQRKVQESRTFTEMVANGLTPLLKIPRSDNPKADLTITLEQYMMSSDISGQSELRRRELAWEVQFFNAQGDRIGRLLDRDQSSGHTATTENRATALAYSIARALGATPQNK